MFHRSEVTDAGYELLAETGLEKKIEENWKKVSDLIPHTLHAEDYEIEELLQNKSLPSSRRIAIEDWLKEHGEFDRTANGLFLVSGTVTDAILSKEEIANVRQFGVENLSALDSLLAAYCLTRHWDKPLSRQSYVWRSNGLKTSIYGDMHGDLQIRQVQTKPKINENTIDGTKITPLFGELPEGHVSAYYSFWPVLTAIALKYADTVGVEIPEVKDWQGFLKNYGWDGKIRDPGLNGVGYEMFVIDYNNSIIAQLPDKTDTQKVRKHFFGQMQPDSHDVYYLPLIDLEQRLVFCYYHTKLEKGDFSIGRYGVQMPYASRIIIPKEDAGHLFKGAVHGIMTGQSRTNPSYLAFMFWQYDQIKAGESEEQIREEGTKFRGW